MFTHLKNCNRLGKHDGTWLRSYFLPIKGQQNRALNNCGFGIGTRLDFCRYHLLIMYPWATYSISQAPSPLIFKMGITVWTSYAGCGIRRGKGCEMVAMSYNRAQLTVAIICLITFCFWLHQCVHPGSTFRGKQLVGGEFLGFRCQYRHLFHLCLQHSQLSYSSRIWRTLRASCHLCPGGAHSPAGEANMPETNTISLGFNTDILSRNYPHSFPSSLWPKEKM